MPAQMASGSGDPALTFAEMVRAARLIFALLLCATFLAACSSGRGPAPIVPAAYLTHTGTDQFAGDYFAIPKAAVAIDYRATGTCLFSFRLFAEASEADNVDTPSLKPSGAEVAGTWHLTVKPGRYALGGGGDGCSWSVTVREARQPSGRAPGEARRPGALSAALAYQPT